MDGAILDHLWYFVDSHVLLILKCPQQQQVISCKIRKCFLSCCKRKFTLWGSVVTTLCVFGSVVTTLCVFGLVVTTLCAFGCGCRHLCAVLSWTHFVLL